MRTPTHCYTLEPPAHVLKKLRSVATSPSSVRACARLALRAAQRHAVADASVLAVLRPLDSEADGPDHASTELPTPWTRTELGAALGRGPRSRLLLLKGAPSRRLLRKLRLRAALG